MSLSPSLRKAAVLLSSLDEAAAEAILGQMPAEDAAKVRSALVELDEIPKSEQERVLAEFLRGQMPMGEQTAGVELLLDPALEERLGPAALALPAVPAAPLAATPPATAAANAGGSLFSFLDEVSPADLANVLQNEHPQTAAVVVSQLCPQRAADVLQLLPAPFATEALERIASIDEISSEVLAELARELRRQLAPQLRYAKPGSPSMTHLTAVLQAMDYRQRQRLLLQLGERNNTLLQNLGLFPVPDHSPSPPATDALPRFRLDSVQSGPPAITEVTSAPPKETAHECGITFADFLALDDASLRAVFAAADPELSLLALTGAEPRLISRILRRLPRRQAATLRTRLEHPGAVRLRDIEQAREALAAVANRLAGEGSVELPAQRRLAVAS